MTTTVDPVGAVGAVVSHGAAPMGQVPTIRIQAQPGWVPINLREIFLFRELLVFLAMRDIKVRYSQTLLGVSWALFQPLTQMVLFTFLFGYLTPLGTPDPGLSKTQGLFIRAISTFGALLPWQLFSSALTQSANSLVNNERLITKTYFPRLLIPMASILAATLDFLIASGVLFGMMLVAMALHVPGLGLTLRLLTLPVFSVLAMLAALTTGLWLSSLSVQYRDLRVTLPFLTQLLMYASPIAYSARDIHLASKSWAPLYGLNPLAGIAEGFRWAILGPSKSDPPGLMLVVSASITVVALVGALYYFRRMEKTLADVL